MHTYIHCEILSIGTQVALIGIVFSGSIAIISIIITLSRNKKNDHKDEHEKLEEDLTEKIKVVETTLSTRIDKYEATNTRSHAEMKEEFDRRITEERDEILYIRRGVDDIKNWLLNKK